MENVPEILKAYGGIIRDEIVAHLESCGYQVVTTSLNAAYYGVPQTRSRAFFLASLERLPSLPQATHSGDIRNAI
ncbi:Cytosine specific DNA methyltransferase (fragment) [Microcystis aeruginosa PCC 9809]|uniref:DNA (cytosine-5-)-methyltransferase n=2 Tax=Microcystis aeruginosa TaxID=1126 RepID=I4HU08_MICAE